MTPRWRIGARVAWASNWRRTCIIAPVSKNMIFLPIGRSFFFSCVDDVNVLFFHPVPCVIYVVIDEFLLYAQTSFIKGKVLNRVAQGFNDAILPVVSRRARFVGIDFDARENYIYYSDVVQNIIYRIHRNGTGKHVYNLIDIIIFFFYLGIFFFFLGM